MASNFCIQLSDSAGLMKVIIFAGLSHQVIVHPILHGEPVLTAQAYYYLSDLESVAQIRFEGVKNKLNLDEIDYLIDNYLFEFSKIYPDTKMSVKVARSNGKFWVNNSRNRVFCNDCSFTSIDISVHAR